MKLAKLVQLIPLIMILITISAGISLAEPVMIRHVVKQTFAGNQSPDDARAAALVKAKREVLEKAGTYIDSIKVVKERQLVQNQVLALSSAILKAEIVSQKNCVSGEAFCVEIEASVLVDTSTLEDRVKKFLDERTALEKAARLEDRERELLAKIRELEDRNRGLNSGAGQPSDTDHASRELSRQFSDAAGKLKAVEANRKAMELLEKGRFSDPEKALSYLNEAILQDPGYSDAFNNRGILNAGRGKQYEAIRDFGRAIELDPGNVEAICNLGNGYSEMGQYGKAVENYDMAIKADPKNEDAYFNRGLAAYNAGNYSQAIDDFDRAIHFNAKDAGAYKYRALSYLMAGDKQRFCDDLAASCGAGNCDGQEKARSEGYCK